MLQQEKAIKFLTAYKKYRILWWGFGPTLLEDLCKEKKFDVKEFLDKKDKEQCIELLKAFSERKVYWWWPWSGKVKDIVIDSKQCQRAREYKNYSWFWKIVLGLFTSVLVHRQVLKWNSTFVSCGGYMYKSDVQGKGPEVPTRPLNTPGNVIDLNGKFETVGDTLNSLGLSGLLQQLDDSLEKVRRNIESRDGHEQLVKKLDKKMQKLCLQVHPDKVRNRGGSEEEIAKAQERQAALSASRTVIKNISEHFLDLIHVDCKYEFYGKMKIGLLGNAKVLNRLNFKMLMELSTLSRIKQEEVIGNINKFLKASNASIESFINSYYEEDNKKAERDFEKNRNDALYHLRMCISGYEKLNNQLDEVKKECRKDEELNGLLYDSICKMSEDSAKQLKQLKGIETFTKVSLEGKFSVVNPEGQGLDDYFVLPFATYVSALLICSMSRKGEKSLINRLWSFISSIFSSVFSSEKCEGEEKQHEQGEDLYGEACCLMLYFNDKGKYKEKVKGILGKKDDESISDNDVKDHFIGIIIDIRESLAQKFKPDNYIERGGMKEHTEQLRELEKRVDNLISKMQEDLKQAQEIREDQKKNREQLENLKEMIENFEKQRKKSTKVQNNAAKQPSSSLSGVEQMSRSKLLRSDGSNNKTRKEMKDQEMSSYVRHEETAHNGTNDQGASTSQQQSYSQSANDQQHESGAQASCAQPSQQQEPNAQAANDQQQESCTQAANDQPNSKLGEVHPISRSQSLNSLHSDDSDIEVISKSQCR
ncbi:hypothetical protein [Wolbachia endosymbiont of Oedothorax gibbosus]|uniref:hypothetical protein n=1 Tax=Wolbachia endosymbiont of Oedothorax gibbosus TaxID=931100 RepID=UPI00202405DE|nr:hypothetical protein [Wolbachia endosymbiont of Oedothorax gibbosus]